MILSLHSYLITLVFLLTLNVDVASNSATIQGVVTDEQDNVVAAALVFTIQGEEETVTNAKGEFKLVTWQKLPVTLNIQHFKHENKQIRISETDNKVNIKLKRK